MPSISSLALLTIFLIYIASNVVPFVRNLRRARASGIPYVAVTHNSYNRIASILMSRLVLRPCSKVFGDPSPSSWRTLVISDWARRYRLRPFSMLGTDTFLTVAPGGMILYTSNAKVVSQITSRHTDFPKASHLYRLANVYGENVVATEGATWRYHRKLVNPMFGENNNELVWDQSLRDASAMLSIWLRNKEQVITTMTEDTTLLSLSVIGRAGLGQSIRWPSAKVEENRALQEESPSHGHQITFTTALTTVLRNIYYIILLPPWLLRYAPIKVVKESYMAYTEWGQYLRETISMTRSALSSSSDTRSSDLLSTLLREHEQSTLSSKADRHQLSDSEILGNLFVIVLAGHETSASSIHFCLVLLAMHPEVQREVQIELDLIFGNRPAEIWQYERDLPKLLNSKLNAVLSEELRMFAPTPTIPKYTTSPQTLNVNGKDVTVPARTIIKMCLPALHRNPAYWQSSSSEMSVQEDVETFRPSRWFNADGSWYQPVKGSYIPFSDGARACLGKRFAQVEILAVLALILSSHSIELAVDEHAFDPQVIINDKERQQVTKAKEESDVRAKEAWQNARDQARQTMNEKIIAIFSLRFVKGSYVPVKVVKRGQERFPVIS